MQLMSELIETTSDWAEGEISSILASQFVLQKTQNLTRKLMPRGSRLEDVIIFVDLPKRAPGNWIFTRYARVKRLTQIPRPDFSLDPSLMHEFSSGRTEPLNPSIATVHHKPV
jgi:hypothetical protein